MGGWKRTEETVYAVAWDDERIVKIGQSMRQRWRRFLLRDGRLVDLFPITKKEDCNLESEMHAAALTMVPLAFREGHEAVPFLGDCGGYLECYRLPEGMTADALLRECSSIVLEQRAQAAERRMLAPMLRTNETDARTHGDSVTLR